MSRCVVPAPERPAPASWATCSTSRRAPLPLATTHNGHDAATRNLREGNGLLYARHSQDAIDRNTVDMDRERASFTDNTVKYEATLRFINGSVRTMLDAMKSHSGG
jgi:flagellar basal-body rod protein FlgB